MKLKKLAEAIKSLERITVRVEKWQRKYPLIDGGYVQEAKSRLMSALRRLERIAGDDEDAGK